MLSHFEFDHNRRLKSTRFAKTNCVKGL